MKKSLLVLILYLFIQAGIYAQEQEIIQKEKVYKTIAGTGLVADMFYTEKMMSNEQNPAIVFFHGGGWAYGKPSEFHAACRRYAKKGFVTFAIQYRLSVNDKGQVPHPDITLVECVKDARSAMRWVRENAAAFHIDPEKIVAAGQSAGGQLAWSTAMMDDINESTDNLEISPVPNALLLYSSNYNTIEAWADMLMGDRREEIWSVSPYHNLKPGLPPAIAFHGKEDCMVDFYIVDFFNKETLRLGNQYELITYEGRGHYLGEDNEKYATYFDEEIMERTDQFLKDYGFMNQ